jgi:tetratricopeptide (TPR) repeat protein
MLTQASGIRNFKPRGPEFGRNAKSGVNIESQIADQTAAIQLINFSEHKMSSQLREHRSFLWALSFVFVVCCLQIVPAQSDDPTDGETDPVKLFERAQNAHARGDIARALALYEGALKLRPEFPEAEYQRGVALVALDRPTEAEKAFTRAIDLRKDWVLPFSALGNLLAHSARDKEAEPVLRRAMQLGAKDWITLDSLSAIRSRAGDKDEAVALARKATDDESATVSAWTWRGSVERTAADTTAALNSLDRALEIDSNYVPALLERSALRISSGAYENAIQDLKKVLVTKPGDKPVLLQLAHVYGLAGKLDEEKKILEALGATPTDSAPRRDSSVVGTANDVAAANDDDPKIARPALERLILANPKSAKLFGRLGEVTRRTDPEKSAESYRRANEIDPVNPKYAIGYAAALVQLRRFAQAEVVLRRVIAAAPDEYTAHANLALALYELKRYAEALPEYQWLARARPEIAATYFFMATAHDNLGEYRLALDHYEKFLALADQANNKLDIEKVNLRLPRLRDQISRGQGSKRKQP